MTNEVKKIADELARQNSIYQEMKQIYTPDELAIDRGEMKGLETALLILGLTKPEIFNLKWKDCPPNYVFKVVKH